jgi:hypothetical protein
MSKKTKATVSLETETTDKPKKEVKYMEIRFAEFSYINWVEKLSLGQALPAEVAGMLLGRAYPVYDEDKKDEPLH